MSHRGYPSRLSSLHRVLRSHSSGESREKRLGFVDIMIRSYQRCGAAVADLDGRSPAKTDVLGT